MTERLHLPVEHFRDAVDAEIERLLSRPPSGRYTMADVDEALEIVEDDLLSLVEWGLCRQVIREVGWAHPQLEPLTAEWIVRHDALWDEASVFAEHTA